VGDLIPGPMLAHKASAEGIAAVEAWRALISRWTTTPSPPLSTHHPRWLASGKRKKTQGAGHRVPGRRLSVRGNRPGALPGGNGRVCKNPCPCPVGPDSGGPHPRSARIGADRRMRPRNAAPHEGRGPAPDRPRTPHPGRGGARERGESGKVAGTAPRFALAERVVEISLSKGRFRVILGSYIKTANENPHAPF